MTSELSIEIPGYSLGELLGMGGMARVYLGHQQSLNRPVAIKVLNATLVSDPVVQQQFQQESLLVAQLNHPNIIQVIDQGSVYDERGHLHPYFVMQYVKSIPLSSVIRRQDVSLTRKLDIIIQICKALSYAHRNGVVHRDIKPANVLVDYDGHVRVVDFGIAGYFRQASDGVQSSSGTVSAVMGTPAYMAPEQEDPTQQVTHLSDIYALGVLMHELLTGVKPGESNGSAVSVSKAVLNVVHQCLQIDVKMRPPTAEEVSSRLLMLLQGKHLKNPRWEKEQKSDQLPGDYKLLDVLKENEFGTSYLVSDPQRKRWLVVKKQQLAYEGNAYSSAQALVASEHPNIVTIHGTARNDRVFILVMEYVSGGSLQERLAQAFSLDRWLLLAEQVCEGLQYAHEQGLVHGNLRPSNILVESAAHIKLTDFGFDDHSVGDGTDWYQPLGEEKTIASDVFSVGAVLFHLLTGQAIQQGAKGVSNFELMANLPKVLQAILRKMLAHKPERRYQTVREVKDALRTFMDKLETQVQQPLKKPAIQQAPSNSGRARVAKWLLLLVGLFFIAELLWLLGFKP